MGLAEVSRPDPCHPLRRRQNYIPLPEGTSKVREDCLLLTLISPVTPFTRVHLLPPIPKVDRRDAMKPCKDFIRENITNVIHRESSRPRRYIVSDRRGTKFLIDGSGLQKEFIHKKASDPFSSKPSLEIFLELWSNPTVSATS